ncbi:plasmid mobilization protein [Acuticoccus yangtzensis]|uniref:plasmid mobilization protein n=1 Tax=Acuticoccus yangtzensis TaxID=1443441 RepID=UPI000D3E7FAA|nr:plasmid mobilization relaxosome protein MobC [Acuticoccus yangtzensis]
MARPTKAAEEKRSETARFRLTVAERAFLRAQADAAGLTETEFLRRRALGLPVRAASQRSDPALVSELNRIGVNVNQLARATHRGSDFTRYWREVGAKLESVLAHVVARDGA